MECIILAKGILGRPLIASASDTTAEGKARILPWEIYALVGKCM
jgi:hypothetical protein